MFISDLLLSLGDRIAFLVQKTTIKKVYGTTKFGFSEYKEIKRINWRSQWHPSPVLLPGKSHRWRSQWAAIHGVAKSWT